MKQRLIAFGVIVFVFISIFAASQPVARSAPWSGPAAVTPGPNAGTVILQGNCVKIGVKPNGTLGIGSGVKPGIQYDKTCTGTFSDSFDFLTPGSPWENLNVKLDSTSLNLNNTGGSTSIGSWSSGVTQTIRNLSGVPYRGTQYDNRVVTIISNSVAVMENDIRFNNFDQYVDITTYVTPTNAVSVGYISRAIDSDAVITGGDDSATNNARGYSEIATKYLVFSETTSSKAVMGYYTGEDGADVNTGISPLWSQDSAVYHGYTGGNSPNSDDTIGIAKKFTSVAAGTAMVFKYAYIFGDSAYNGAEPPIRTGAAGGIPGVVPGCPGCVLSDSGSAIMTNTPNPAGTNTPRPTNTSAPVSGPTFTASRTSTPTNTSTRTNTSTNTATATRTNTGTRTSTRTNTATATRTSTNTVTASRTSTNTATNTNTRTSTNTPTNTNTRTSTNTVTASRTSTNTATNTSTRTSTNTRTSTPTPQALTIKKAAVGNLYVIGLLQNGSLVSWGKEPMSLIRSLLAGRTFTDVAAGISNAFVLESTGDVYVWGEGGFNLIEMVGGLGRPKPVNARSGVSAIAAGGNFAIAIKTDGSMVVWGDDSKNQVSAAPKGTGYVSADGGDYHALAVKSDGTVVGWGENSFGKASPPPGLTGVVAVSAGKDHSLALLSNGQVVGWGSNAFGQISIPSAAATNVIAIAAGRDCSLAVTAQGAVVVWGSKQFANFPSVPTSGAVAVAADNQNSIIALRNTGVLVAGNLFNKVDVSRTATRTPTP